MKKNISSSSSIVNRKDHPVFSAHRQPCPSSLEEGEQYLSTWWKRYAMLIGIAILVISIISLMIVGGCDDSPNPTNDDTSSKDIIDEFVGDTTDETADETTGTDATDTLGVDVVEEVISDPCADYRYIENPMDCCEQGTSDCRWENTCQVYERDGICYINCERFTNGYETEATNEIYDFNPPTVTATTIVGVAVCTILP